MASAAHRFIWQLTGIGELIEIAAHLNMQRQNVGPDLRVLGEEGLLEIVDVNGGRDIWAKKSIDGTLRISKYLRDEYHLNPDGRLGKATKKASAKKKVK